MLIHIDLDDTLCDYSGAYKQALENEPERQWPQSKEGFFLALEPLDQAIESVNLLKDQGHQIYFLTAPSYKNPYCYLEKRLWVERYFGLEMCRNLIISANKGLLLGDYLVDDCQKGKGQENFNGKLVHFGSEKFKDWPAVIEYFSSV